MAGALLGIVMIPVFALLALAAMWVVVGVAFCLWLLVKGAVRGLFWIKEVM